MLINCSGKASLRENDIWVDTLSGIEVRSVTEKSILGGKISFILLKEFLKIIYFLIEG